MTRQAFPVLTPDQGVASTAAERATSLDGFDTTALDSGHFAVVTAGALVGRMYRLDVGSAAAADGVTVIAPLTGPGRWLEWPGPGGGGAATFTVDGISTGTTQLSAIPTGALETGSVAYVETVEDEFTFDADSALTADGITIVDGNGGGQWLRREHVGNQRWREQAEWHIDAGTGNDENDGSAGNPLASWAELRRRLGANPVIPQATEILIESDLLEVLSFDGAAVPTGLVAVRGGVKTTLQSGTLSGVTAQDRGTQTPMQLDDAGLDAFVDKRIRFTDGAAAGATCWAFRSPGAGLLDCVQAITYDASADPLPASGTAVTPGIGDSYVVEDLFQVDAVQLDFQRTDISGAGSAVVEEVAVVDANASFMLRGRGNPALFVRSSCAGSRVTEDTNMSAFSSFFNSTNHRGEFEDFHAALVKSPVSTIFFVAAVASFAEDTIGSGGSLVCSESRFVFGDAAVFDSNAAGVNMAPNTTAVVGNGATVWGDGNNSYGWLIEAGALVVYETGAQPTLTGDTNDTHFGGADVAYAGIPSFDAATASGMVENI